MGGANASLWRWKFILQNGAGLNGFDPRNDLVLGRVRIGMGCMNLVTVISRYTRVPVTLSLKVTGYDDIIRAIT